MKRIQLLLVFLVASIGISLAQPGERGQRMSPEERENKMVEALALDEAQQAKLKAINENYRESFTELRKEMQAAADNREELREKMKTNMDKRNQEIRALLTPEQVKKFDEMQKQREDRMKNRRMPHKRGGDKRPGK